jgi:transposase
VGRNPHRYGPSTSYYNRLVRWRKSGVWDRLFAAVSAAFEYEIVVIDSTCVRVHQHGATGKKGDPMISMPAPFRRALTERVLTKAVGIAYTNAH